MSDPAQKVEIEDVLTSIRRLVSNGHGLEDNRKDRNTPCFLLTPALRVDSGVKDGKAISGPPLDLDIYRCDVTTDDVRAGVSSQQFDSAGEDGHSTLQRHDDGRKRAAEVDISAFRQNGDAFVLRSVRPTDQPDTEESDDRGGSPRGVSGETNTSDTGSSGKVSSGPETSHAHVRSEMAQSEPFLLTKAYAISDDAFGGSAVSGADGLPVALGAKKDALDTVITESRDHRETDRQGGSHDAKTTVAPFDGHDRGDFERHTDGAAIGGKTQLGVSASPASGRTPDSLADHLGLDQELLQKLVADLVRQELQGALKDSVNRNVQNMVRHELRRVLAELASD